MINPHYYLDPYCRDLHTRVVGVEADQILLEQTIFYPTGGGQPGDTGTFETNDHRRFQVIDTTQSEMGPLHHLADANHGLKTGDELRIRIDWDRRHRLMRMHTSLHLLCSVVPVAVTGGSVGVDRSRLDFDIGDHSIDKADLTHKINSLIKQSLPVSVESITDEDLDTQPELVRTMSVAPPRGSGVIRMIRIADTDFQPCGGTHVRNTAEIGSIEVTKIENKGKRNRRVHLVLTE